MHPGKLRINSEKSFTLIEILVVVAIIIIILALTLASYRTGNQRLTLKRAVHKLAQDIRKTQEMAMSTKEFQGGIPQGGYGLVFATYQIAGVDFPHLYMIYTYTSDNNTDDAVETIKLENGVKVSKIFVISGGSETEKNSTFFNFIPPEPKTCIEGCAFDGVRIVLSLDQDSSVTRSVKINKTGLVEIIE